MHYMLFHYTFGHRKKYKVQYNYSIFKPIQYLYLIISRILYNATLIYKLELCV